jgi:chromosomal replication initiation ATPase DnaA
VRARFAAVYLAEKLKRLSTTDLARRFAKQDHVTIINALSRAREFMKSEPDFAGRVALVEQELLRGRS